MRIYNRRADIGAIVHAHPPVATGFAVAGEGFASGILPEVIFLLGRVPLVPYEMPGTEALARVMIEGENQFKIEGYAQKIADAIEREIGAGVRGA